MKNTREVQDLNPGSPAPWPWSFFYCSMLQRPWKLITIIERSSSIGYIHFILVEFLLSDMQFMLPFLLVKEQGKFLCCLHIFSMRCNSCKNREEKLCLAWIILAKEWMCWIFFWNGEVEVICKCQNVHQHESTNSGVYWYFGNTPLLF